MDPLRIAQAIQGMTVVALCLFLALPAQAETAYERIMRTGEIRCGYAASPPSLMIDANTGEISGIDYEVMEEIGKELNLKITWAEEVGWGNFIESLKTGRIDIFCSQSWPNPARTKFLSMAGPVLYSKLYAYVRPDDTRFDGNIERINQSDIAVPAIDGDVGVHMIETRFPKARVETLPQMATVSDMFLSVVSKKSDVIFLNENFYQQLSKHNEGRLRRVKDVPAAYVFGSYYTVMQGEYALRDILQVTLQMLIDDGRLEKIAKKHGPDFGVPQPNYKAPQ